jgi:hypothetical protein
MNLSLLSSDSNDEHWKRAMRHLASISFFRRIPLRDAIDAET